MVRTDLYVIVQKGIIMPRIENLDFDPNDSQSFLEALVDYLDRWLQELLAAIEEGAGPPEPEWLTCNRVAEILKKRPFTVREWCRLGRIESRRLASGERRISKEEVERFKRDGLLSDPNRPRFE